MLGYALYGGGLMRSDDVIYTMLPMYHSSANGLCSGAAMLGGNVTVTITVVGFGRKQP